MRTSRSVLAFLAGLILPSFLGTACLTHSGEQHPLQDIQDIQDLPDQHVELPSQVKTALTNVRVFDGHKVNEPSTIIFDGNRITADDTNIVNTIDGQNGILLPGLIDSHCHPESNKDLDDLARYGVSTAMSMSCGNYTKCAAFRNQVGRTTYFAAGHAAIGPGSAHAKAQGLSGDRVIHSASQAFEWVNNVFNNGSDYLKITAELDGPDQETQNALVSAAQALGKKTMTHAAELEYYVQAILSKTNGPQHIPFDAVLNHTMLDLMLAQNQFATPTTILYKLILPRMAKLRLDAGKVDVAQAYAVVQENVRNMHARGIPVLAGTDSVAQYLGLSVPFGTSLHDEIADLVEIGMEPAEAIRAATATPAEMHDLKDRGVIADGTRADLLLLQPDADPFNRNISDTRKVARFWIGGIEQNLSD